MYALQITEAIEQKFSVRQRCNLSPLQFYTFTANDVDAIGEGNKHVPHIGEDVYSWSAVPC